MRKKNRFPAAGLSFGGFGDVRQLGKLLVIGSWKQSIVGCSRCIAACLVTASERTVMPFIASILSIRSPREENRVLLKCSRTV